MTHAILVAARSIVAALLCAGCSAASAPPNPNAALPDGALTPAAITLRGAPNVFVDAGAQLSAGALTADTSGARPRLTWFSFDPAVASVNQDGLVVGHDTGTTLIRAFVGRHAADASITVVPDSDSTIVIIAHRGFMRRFPENTLVAVNGAFESGADAVEVDIRLSADRVPVVMHDETVDRTTDGRGAVKDLTLAQLTALNACAHAKVGTIMTCPLPTMAQVLAAAHGKGGVLLHLYGSYTSADLQKMLQAVRDADMNRKTVFICFDYPTLQALRQLDQAVPLGYLSTGIPALDQVDGLGRAAALLELQASITASAQVRDYLAAARRRGIDAGVWATGDQSQARTAVALGFRHLISDVPLDRATLAP